MTTPIIARVEDSLARDIEFFSREEKLDKSAVVRRLLSKAVRQEKIDLALKRYGEEEISLARAAETAEIPLAEMLALAAKKKISLHYTQDDLLRDFGA
ncbi:MAG: UPF0175 family protein [Nanoarchaeota archaeon]|nr:UPF0175 family protein [Nanoarchaeota archaeon]